MPGVIGAFVGREKVERESHQAADLVVGSRTSGAQERFQFGKRQLDRIEVGTVGRQKAKPRADLLDRRTDLGLPMDGQVVEHDHIAGAERGDQHLLDVREETRTVDRAIEHRWRAKPIKTQRGDDRVRLPMTAGRVIPESGAARAPAIAT